MTPDDLCAVERSWIDLRHRRIELAAHLAASFAARDGAEVAAQRASWLVDAVGQLVGLLTAPSRLGDCARAVASAFPVAGTAPSYAVDGQAWMDAGRGVSPAWTPGTEAAWRHAWLLLSDVLAEESLSPFSADAPRRHEGSAARPS